MRIATSTTNRGIAIIIVMVSMFALAILAGAFAYTMKVETRLAMNSDYETQFQWAGRSGIEYCRWILAEGLREPGTGQRYDALDQAWAGGSAETNDTLLQIAQTYHQPLSLGPGVVIKDKQIVDLDRKVNVNSATGNPQLLQKALLRAGAEVTEIPDLISCIQDWIDPDDDPRVNGAESDYYRSLDPPYYAKNGSMDEVSELLLVKGMTPELYWGMQSTNHPSPIFQRQVVTANGIRPASSQGTVALRDLLTTTSSGVINILTASPSQLQVLPQVDETLAGQIVQLRGEHDAAAGLAYANPAELLSYTSLGKDFAQQIAPYCTFRSTTFEITVLVQVGLAERTYFAVVRRNSPNDIPILSMRWEDGNHLQSSGDQQDSDSTVAAR